MTNQRNYAVRRSDQYQGLIDIPVLLNDVSDTSPNYFVFSDIPDELTAGKNSIKIAGNPNTLVLNTEIAVETLDANGKTIFTEVNDYLDTGKRRVITINVYPDTTPGPVSITFVGIVNRYLDDKGNWVPVSKTWQRKYNIRWTKTLYCSPTKRNTTEILFKKLPSIRVREVYRVDNISSLIPGAAVEQTPDPLIRFSNSTATQLPAAQVIAIEEEQPIIRVIEDPEGTRFADDLLDDLPGDFTPIYQNPEGTDPAVPSSRLPAEINDTIVYNDEVPLSVVTTQTPTGNSGRGSYLEVPQSEDTFSSPSHELFALEKSPTLVITPSGSFEFTLEMEGGIIKILEPPVIIPTGYEASYTLRPYRTTIKKVLSATTVVMDNPYQFTVNQLGNASEYLYQPTTFENANFEISYSEDPTFTYSQAYKSHAYVEIGNIKPITGDVHKIKVYAKSHSTPYDFEYMGEQILETTNLLQDTASISSISNLGNFSTQNIVDTYWTASAEDGASAVTLETGSDVLLNGLNIVGTELTTGEWHLTTNEYKNIYYDDSSYQFVLDIYGESRNNVPAEMEIYMSGSAFFNNISILKAKVPSGKTTLYHQLVIPFRTNLIGYGQPKFVVRSGNWQIANIKLQPLHETGYAPSHTLFTVPVKTSWDSDVLDFKFEFLDYKENLAGKYLVQNNVNVQYGPAQFIQGFDNLVTGSLYLGNVIGEGIEMAGANSAYIRNIGYDGWTSASDATGGHGFMMWSGSIFPGGPDAYDGVGLELIGASGSLRFRTNPSVFEVIADQFFIGSYNTQFISGAQGSLEISSSDFWLKSDGTLIIGADAVIYGSLTVDSILVPTSGPPYSASITPDGRAVFSSGSISYWHFDEYNLFISSASMTPWKEYLLSFGKTRKRRLKSGKGSGESYLEGLGLYMDYLTGSEQLNFSNLSFGGLFLGKEQLYAGPDSASMVWYMETNTGSYVDESFFDMTIGGIYSITENAKTTKRDVSNFMTFGLDSTSSDAFITGSITLHKPTYFDTGSYFSGSIFLGTGSDYRPALAFIDDPDTGIYNAGPGSGMRYATDGSWEFWMAAGGTFHADGDMVGYSTTLPSDLRLKKNIEPVGDVMDRIMDLEPVSFEWKREDKEGRHYGFIAQDMEQIFPSVVKEIESPFFSIEEQFETYKTIQYDRLIPILTKAIIELKEEVDELKKSDKNLEN